MDGEGLMLHRGALPLTVGERSGGLLKVKPYEDAEARVVGDTCPAKRHMLATLGALMDRVGRRQRFKLGTGLPTPNGRSRPPSAPG